MPFHQTIYPQFRDADPDGLVGLRGAMRYFQDIHTWFFHAIDKGNDVLPQGDRMSYKSITKKTGWQECGQEQEEEVSDSFRTFCVFSER